MLISRGKDGHYPLFLTNFEVLLILLISRKPKFFSCVGMKARPVAKVPWAKKVIQQLLR